MSTVLEPIDSTELTTFRKQDAAIAVLAEQYMPLRINGLNDKAGFDAVHKARMIVKSKRVEVEKKRKELKADALKFGQTVDAEARRLTELLEPIESHLEAEEDAVVKERERIKNIAEEAKRAALQKRLDALGVYDPFVNPLTVADMTEEMFQAELAKAKAAFEERQRAEREAAEQRKAEEARLATERVELDRIRKEQEAERAKLEAERRAVEVEKARHEAAEKSRIETEQRLAAQAAREKAEAAAREAKAKADAEAAEQARLKAEAERPQREKLLAIAKVVDAIDVPEGPGCAAVEKVLIDAVAKIRHIANGPLA